MLEWYSLDNLPSKEEMAFDHGDDLEIYSNFLKEKLTLPVIGKFSDSGK